MVAAPNLSLDRTEISREEIARRLRDPSLILVHALPADSYAAGHIPGARSLPAADIPARAAAVLPDRTAEIAVYCGSSTCPVAEEVIGKLRALGYTNLRRYGGGLAEWEEKGGALDSAPATALVQIQPTVARAAATHVSGPHQWGAQLVELIERQSPSRLFVAWLVMIVCSSVVYWLAGLAEHHGLLADQRHVGMNLQGFLTAVYFSFVTATSVGYGDVTPMGAVRVIAVAEAVTGLLIFGAVVAKFVSRRQDELVTEIHRVTFEERLDRVQTSLHLVLAELQGIAALCDDGTARPERVGSRLESAALVFASELRAIHGLLYRPRWAPQEQVMGAILASLAAALRELRDLLTCLPPGIPRSPTLQSTLAMVARLAAEICGECVPHTYAPSLTMWMDRVHELARGIA